MGQIYFASAYDIDEKIAFILDADKFHANCYTYSGAVTSIHYLLRQKAYNVMWGGFYVMEDDYLEGVSCTRILLGLSTFLDYEFFDERNENLKDKSYHGLVQYIDDKSKEWNYLNWRETLNKSVKYFDYDNTKSVTREGYLLNHTQKQYIDLAEYYGKSEYRSNNKFNQAIDLIPVLTETGGGAHMAFLDGVSAESTEYLAGERCGDLLQIVDELDDATSDYRLIKCCFVDIWQRARYLYETYGVNDDGLILACDSGSLYEGVGLTLLGKRRPVCNVKVEVNDGKVRFESVYKD